MQERISRCGLIFAVLLGGCEQKAPEAWGAQAAIEVYKDYKYKSQTVKFKLVAGDISVPVREEYSKAFVFREVICPHRGIGWVRSLEFEVFDAEHPEGRPWNIPTPPGHQAVDLVPSK